VENDQVPEAGLIVERLAGPSSRTPADDLYS
jgi:hypothetical protein